MLRREELIQPCPELHSNLTPAYALVILRRSGNGLLWSDPYLGCFRRKLAASLLDLRFAPVVVVGQFPRQHDVALRVALAFRAKRMVPKLLVVGAQTQVARPVEILGVNAFGLGPKGSPPFIIQCLRHHMFD